MRGEAELLHALASQMQGKEQEAVDTLIDLLNRPGPEGNVRKTRQQLAVVLIYIVSGKLDKALAANHRLRDLAALGKYEYAGAWSMYPHGLIHFLQNDMDSAIEYLSRIVEKRYLLEARVVVDSMAGLAYSYQAKGCPDRADAILKILLEYAGALKDPAYSIIARCCQARLTVMRGEWTPDMNWLRECPPVESMLWWLEVPVLTHCRVLLFEEMGESTQKAEMLLQDLLKLTEGNHNLFQTVNILLLLTLSLSKSGRIDDALDVLGRACTLAGPGKIIQPFVEHGQPMEALLTSLRQQTGATDLIDRILAAFSKTQNASAPNETDDQTLPAPSMKAQPLIEPLTRRELETLNLLAMGFVKKEIAEKLFISPETVKSHLKNIYQKLDANNRRMAIDKARALGIISSSQILFTN
jgi:LuxR family maltose regulon positive regulatory protein